MQASGNFLDGELDPVDRGQRKVLVNSKQDPFFNISSSGRDLQGSKLGFRREE